MDEAALQDTVDHTGVMRLLAAYADVANRRAWPEMAELFRPDAVVEVDRRTGDPIRLRGPDAVGTFIGTSIERFSFFEFVVLNAHVALPAGGSPGGERTTATARVFIWELRQDRESGRWTNAYGVYHDRYRKIDGRWWFDGRLYHSLARTAADTELFPFPSQLATGGLGA